MLFKKEIKPDHPDYLVISYAETLFRYFELEYKNSSCMKCNEQKEKYKNWLITKFFLSHRENKRIIVNFS